MKADAPTKEQLIQKIESLNKRVIELEESESYHFEWVNQISRLSNLKEKLISISDFNQKLKLIADFMVKNWDVEIARIWIIKNGDICNEGCLYSQKNDELECCYDKTRCLHLVVSSGQIVDIDDEYRRIPFGCSNLGKIASGKYDKIISNNIVHDLRGHDQNLAKKLGLISFAGFRLISQDNTPLGVVAIFSKHKITSHDEKLLKDMASTLSQVIISSEAKNALEKSEIKYKALFENSGTGMLFVDEDMTIFLVNKKLEHITGYSKEEVEGKKKWTEFIARREDLEKMKVYHMMRRSDPESVPHSYEFQLKDKSGHLRDIIATVSMIPGTNKSLAAIMDISQRKQFERQLKESEEKFREVFNNANDALYLTRVSGKGMNEPFIEVNDVACHMLGYSREEFLQMTPADIDDSDSADINKKMEKILKIGNYTFNTSHRAKNGLMIPVEINARVFELKEEKVLLAIARDITERKLAEQKIKESEENFRALAENAQDGIIIFKGKNTPDSLRFVYTNQMAAKITGYAVDELIGKSMVDLAPPEEFEKLMKIFKARMNSETAPPQYETLLIRKDNEIIPTELTGAKTYWKGQEADLVIFRDISERRDIELTLKASEEKYRLLVETAAGGIVLLDMKGKIIDANANVLKMAGLKRNDVIGKNLIRLLPKIKIDTKKVLADFKNILKNEPLDNVEWSMINSRGEEVIFIPHYSTIKDGGKIIGISVLIEDITERKNMENQLKKSLEEKEMLLKEIHHRVKNNLMVISSLLNLQSGYIKDKQALKFFEESQSRARSMAIIHEKLYQSSDLKNINFGEYIRTLTSELFRTYRVDPGLVKLKLDLENIKLDINTAIPLGLIVNELVSNSMKHAFPSGQSGEINIILHKLDEHYILEVRDDGVGFPEDINFQMTESLGLQLINSLVGQIDATIKLDKSQGTNFTIKFKELKLGT